MAGRRPHNLVRASTEPPIPQVSRRGGRAYSSAQRAPQQTTVARLGGPTLDGVTLLERVQSDITTAMKSGERERVGALRLVSSELQKAHKEAAAGSEADEVAVLQRERKRRLEAA